MREQASSHKSSSGHPQGSSRAGLIRHEHSQLKQGAWTLVAFFGGQYRGVAIGNIVLQRTGRFPVARVMRTLVLQVDRAASIHSTYTERAQVSDNIKRREALFVF